ncbi:hypothetical protein GUL10_18965 [Stenotrophomonas maltophilia]|nr:hypothetical protein [Stenotrophomonas maltophilia]
MDGLVLSGVPGIVLSGVRLSCYQEYENTGKPITARVCGPSNFPNKKYITFRAANKTLSSPSAGNAVGERWDESDTKKSVRRCTRGLRRCFPWWRLLPKVGGHA